MSALPEGDALDCVECSAISPLDDAHDFDPCPACGSDATTAVKIEHCANANCQSEDHHFGYDVHVIAEASHG